MLFIFSPDLDSRKDTREEITQYCSQTSHPIVLDVGKFNGEGRLLIEWPQLDDPQAGRRAPLLYGGEATDVRDMTAAIKRYVHQTLHPLVYRLFHIRGLDQSICTSIQVTATLLPHIRI